MSLTLFETRHFWVIIYSFPYFIPTYAKNVIPLPEFKKLLGSAGEKLTEEEILRIRDAEDRLADIVFEMWLKHRSGPGYKAKR